MNTTDNALMAQVGAGEIAQLAVLFERHHRALFRYFVAMNRDPVLSEDLVQDVFFRILRYRATYDPALPFTSWMYRIARNAGMDEARAAGRRPASASGGIDGAGELEPASPDPGPEESAVRGEDVELLRRALAELPADKREVLVLSRFQGMKYQEIAGVMGCEESTVKVRVYRAMRMLEQVYFQLEKRNCQGVP